MRIIFACFIAALMVVGCGEKAELEIPLTVYKTYKEGPHVVMAGNSAYAFYFTRIDGEISMSKEVIENPDNAEIEVFNPVFDPFKVKLNVEPESVEAEFPASSKVTVISDIEGNYSALYALLKSQGIVNEQGDWTYNDGHLVMLGDLFDRGPDVTPVFWWLYKLEAEARKAGGHVHILLGNHEVMIFEGDTRYINDKYKAQANETGMSYSYLYSTNTVLGKWLRTKPAVIKIGDKLFSHAGISPDVLALGLELQEINELVQDRVLFQASQSNTGDYNTIFGSTGIFWYRGWVDDPPSVDVLNEILGKYGARHVVIGHTIVPNIQASFDYKLIMADVMQPKDVNKSPVRALSIEDGEFYEVNTLGQRKPIESI